METTAWLILLFPLIGCIVIGLGYRVWPARVVGAVGTLAIAAAFVAAVLTTVSLQDRGAEQRQVVFTAWDYAVTSGVDAKLSILVDPLSMFMALVVTGVSTLIHLYSVAYLGGDRGYARFFAYLNFFVFSMLVLVLAGNFLLLIVGWAFVGAASYMLISFWYRRTTATAAGIKAFVINVLGDVGLVLGTFFIFKHSGTLDFLGTFGRAPDVFPKGSADITAGCLLLLVGAFAKSAQVPLHTWLPDAMEGPTPVSALIHAATMVTAGVYLIARMHPLFELAPAAADVGAIIGMLTLLIAGTIGLVVTDLKRVIAYSTMSQIGYMIMGVSAGAYSAGKFHPLHHPLFKAPLVLGGRSGLSAHAQQKKPHKKRGIRHEVSDNHPGQGDGRLPQGDAVHLRVHGDRRPRAVGRAAVLGLAVQGRDPARRRRARRLVLDPLRSRLPRRAAHGDLHVPDDLPRLLGRPGRGGEGARGGPPPPRRGPAQPRDRRGGGLRRRLPGRGAPHRGARVADEGGDGRARARRDRPRRAPDPRRHRGRAQVPRAELRGLEVLQRADRQG